MKKNRITINKFLATILVLFSFISCTDDLDKFPINTNSAEKVYSSQEGYKSVLAKIYGGLSTPVNEGPAGNSDISSDAEGDFLRTFFNMQSLTTEEGITTWTDAGLHDLNFMSWSSSNPFVNGLYTRCLYEIALVNEFLRESTDEKLKSRDIPDNAITEIRYFRNEARFLRAFHYWVLMDIFGNPAFVDENTPVGKYAPEQIERKKLFEYVESELLDIQSKLKPARENEYGRVDQGACRALCARLYLNAEVYTGTPRYTDAISFAKKVIDAGYELKDNYTDLFLADNDQNNNEVILSINYDGLRNQSYGGLCYIINSSFIVTRDDSPGINFREYYGMGGNGGWFGNRARKELPERFNDNDKRKLFIGSKADIEEVGNFFDGLSVAKFRNVTSDGEYGSNYSEAFPDTDFPLFRLAEMYFIYAESVLRGGTGGDMEHAVNYMNKIRERAFGNADYNYSSITLNDVLNERSRELYWECFRRTDLIRYGLFTSSTNLWQWKGGEKDGIGVSDNLNLFPIPASELISNPNIKQNTGY
ncbi:MAG: RagB/SusD family nutrient uptake outer membrane protein [Paludibacter sp.]